MNLHYILLILLVLLVSPLMVKAKEADLGDGFGFEQEVKNRETWR